MKKIRAFDVFGNIAIVKFPKEFKTGHRSVYAKEAREPLRGPKTLNYGARILEVLCWKMF